MHKLSWCILSIAIVCTPQFHLAIDVWAANTTEEDKPVLPPPFVVPEPPENAVKAALKGKGSVERIAVNDKIARNLGFDSAKDAADSNTRLGEPFPLILVSLETITKFDPSAHPNDFLTFTKRFIFPIKPKDSGKTMSSVTVIELVSTANAQHDWKAVEWGSKGLIRRLDQTRDSLKPPSPSFALWIPALSRFFLGFVKNGEVISVPLSKDSKYGFLPGSPKPVAEVFSKLSKEAIAMQQLHKESRKGKPGLPKASPNEGRTK